MEWSTAAGWLPGAAAIALFGCAFSTRHRWLGLLGAVAAAPFLWQASQLPLFHWLGIVAMISNTAAAVLLVRRRPDVAFAALTPALMIAAALAVFAMRGIHLVTPAGRPTPSPFTREMVARNEAP